MAHTTRTSVHSPFFTFLFLSSLLLPLGYCYPVRSLSSTRLTTKSAVGNRYHSSLRTRNHGVSWLQPRLEHPNVWTTKNKLAVGLSVGLGGLFVCSSILLYVGCQKYWHRKICRRTAPGSQIPCPMFDTPLYTPSAQRPSQYYSPHTTLMIENRTSYQPVITTPQSVYSPFSSPSSSPSAYYQPIEVYRALLLRSSYYPPSHLPQPVLSSLPPHMVPPLPPPDPPPVPPAATRLSHPPACPPSPSPPPEPAPTSASAPTTHTVRRLSVLSTNRDRPFSSICFSSSSDDQPMQSPPQGQSQTLGESVPFYSPNPVPPRVAQFLELRQNSVDSSYTQIEQDAMSIRSESVSPRTVPGAVISVCRAPSQPRLPESSHDKNNAGLGIRMPRESGSEMTS
ncbi:hypothetical protein VTO42DRAFT_4960 [Malbranchea cinnamomea]